MKVKIWAVIIATSIALTPLTFYEQLGLTYIDNYIEGLLGEDQKSDNMFSHRECRESNTASTRICPIINCHPALDENGVYYEICEGDKDNGS